MAVSPDELDELHAKAEENTETDTDDTDDTEDNAVYDSIKSASDLLKRNAILFEFLSDPFFCKNLTKRDRAIMLRQADQVYKLIDELDQQLEELGDF